MKIPYCIRRLIARFEAGYNGYLDQIGWIETRALAKAVDIELQPTPWFTYPAVQFFRDRVTKQWRVLEFGAGMGSIWWSRNVQEVVSLEHDHAWTRYIQSQCKAHVKETSDIHPEAYIQPARATGLYDVVIIDGLFRVECIRAALEMVTSDGIIILDDAARLEYTVGVSELRAAGFRSLELHGPQPVNKHPGCTTIFYRISNILGL